VALVVNMRPPRCNAQTAAGRTAGNAGDLPRRAP
jgi:hypothetical protein